MTAPAHADRDAESAGVFLAGADHGDVPGGHRKPQRGQLGDVPDTAVDHQSADAALLGGDGQDLAPVPVRRAVQVGDQNAAGLGGGRRVDHDGLVCRVW